MNGPKKAVKKKKFRLKARGTDILCVTCGVVIGEVIAMLTQNVGFLKWLGYDVSIGFEEPLKFTLVIFKFAIGFSIHLNPAVVLFALLGFFASRYFFTANKKPLKAVRITDEEEPESDGYQQ